MGQTLATGEKTTPWRRRIWLCLCAFLSLSLVVPQTREMHVLITRLLFHLNLNGNTYVRGQPLGCVVYPIPNVQFTQRGRSNIIASAQLSPDAFLLATLLTRDPLDLPPASAWKDCSVVEWSALAVAGRIPSLGHSSSPRTNDPVLLRDSLEVVRTTQQTHPQNGVLWLAEAHLQFALDEDEQAIQALQTALQRGHWNRQIGPAFLHVRKLLEAQGLPQFDASTEATVDLATRFVIHKLQQDIEHSMMSAVTSEDDARFRSLVSLVTQLQQQKWEDKNVTAYLASLSFPAFGPHKDLLDVMAKRLGRPPVPDFKKTKFTEVEEAERTIFRDYLDAYAGPELANNLLRGNETVVQQLKQRQESLFAEDKRIMWLGLGSAISAFFSLCALALLLTAFVMNVAFILIPASQFSVKTLLRTPRFWLLSSVAVAAGICLFTSLLEAVFQHVGFPGPTRKDYWISPCWDHVIVASSICLVWFAFKIRWHWREKPPRWFPMSLAGFGFIYLVAVCFTAWTRFQYVQWVASTYLS
jgi:hypothetical protein